VLEQVLRIVVRELEMAGAAFLGTGLAYGDEVIAGTHSEAGVPLSTSPNTSCPATPWPAIDLKTATDAYDRAGRGRPDGRP